MDALIIIIAIAAVFWWINNNKTKSVVKIKITEKSEYKTPTGTVRVEKIDEYEDSDLSIKNRPKYTPVPPRNYTPIQQPVTIEHDITNKIESRDEYIERTRRHSAELRRRSDEIIQKKPEKYISNHSHQTTKECPNCQRDLPHSSFRSSSKNADGLTKWCSDCLSKSTNESIPSHLKLCQKCGQRRMKSSFAKNSNTNDGLAKWCKYCMIGIKR